MALVPERELVPGREYLVSLKVDPVFLSEHPDHPLVTRRRLTHVFTNTYPGGRVSWTFRDEHQRYKDLPRTELDCRALNCMLCVCASPVVDDDKWYVYVHPEKVRAIEELPYSEGEVGEEQPRFWRIRGTLPSAAATTTCPNGRDVISSV